MAGKFCAGAYRLQATNRTFQQELDKQTEPGSPAITQVPAAKVPCDRPRPVPVEYKRNLEDAAADLWSLGRSQRPHPSRAEDTYITSSSQEQRPQHLQGSRDAAVNLIVEQQSHLLQENSTDADTQNRSASQITHQTTALMAEMQSV